MMLMERGSRMRGQGMTWEFLGRNGILMFKNLQLSSQNIVRNVEFLI